MIRSRKDINQSQRWVVKVGTAVLTRGELSLSSAALKSLAGQIAELRNLGIEVVLVSSGSIVAGIAQLRLASRPDRLNQLQAAAAVGQAALIRSYSDEFVVYDTSVAQVLLTHADIANRERYLNARNTLLSLLDYGSLPVVNENDTVATDEICFGDNDNLAALVAGMLEADLLVLLTDQEGLYHEDPRKNSSAEMVETAQAEDSELEKMAGAGSSLGRGGMITKLSAARKASRSGAATLIANGNNAQVLLNIFWGKSVGTLLLASHRVASKKQWMASQMHSQGEIQIDDGAKQVIIEQGRSLLAVGVVDVQGKFSRGALVTCVDQNGVPIARGLINYSAAETSKLLGQHSDRFAEILGYRGDHELIHRDNLVLI